MTEPYKRKLIEVALPLVAINTESAREKSIRHGHPSTLHLWWARRPLATARAVLWASLVDDPSAHPEAFPTELDQQLERDRLFDILERLVPWEATSDTRVLAEARTEIERSCGGELPNVLDPFGGGGTIPMEALRLGLPTFTGDLNPVAVLIQRAMLDVPQRFVGMEPVSPGAAQRESQWEGFRGLVADVETYGVALGESVRESLQSMYPRPIDDNGNVREPIAWFWVRAIESPDPSFAGEVPLVGSWTIVKKPGKPTVWVEPEVDGSIVRYRVRVGGTPPPGTMKRGKGVCLATGAAISNEYIRQKGKEGRLTQHLVAICVQGERGRSYISPAPSDLAAGDVDADSCWRPSGSMSTNTRHMGTPHYGLDEWWKLFTPRQRIVIDSFIRELEQIRSRIEADCVSAGLPAGEPLREGGVGATAYSEAVCMYLSFVLDRAISRWNSLSIWNPARESLEHVFRMQIVQMAWMFAEANPFSDATGGWSGQIDWVTKAILLLPSGGRADVQQRDAEARVSELEQFVLCTDPPYYDNVPYSDISDFFYVWMRKTLGGTWPDECATLLTPKAEELIAEPERHGSKGAAKVFFESRMKAVFKAAAERSDPRFPSTVFYAFKASEATEDGQTSTGWEAFLEALLDAGLAVTATWPVRTEMAGGVRNAGRNSLASSVVLACRKRLVSAPLATRSEFVSALSEEMAPAVRLLQAQNIAPVDLAQSAIGPGIRIFSRYLKVVESDGTAMRVRAALGLINEILAEVLSGEEAELDADSRFALTWFEQYGHNPGPYGSADVLARAKDTAVAGVESSGIVASRDGKVRLLERAELPADWSPASDDRLTVWEATQHLIRRLDESEAKAADLLRQLGGVADRARQLAYLLYGVCERKGWTDDAVAYNGLITAWPELARQASVVPSSGPAQQRLI